jgi:hypothetical protein
VWERLYANGTNLSAFSMIFEVHNKAISTQFAGFASLSTERSGDGEANRKPTERFYLPIELAHAARALPSIPISIAIWIPMG